MTLTSDWVPVDACTLPTEQQPLRLAEFDALFRSALRRTERRDDTWVRQRQAVAAERRSGESSDDQRNQHHR